MTLEKSLNKELDLGTSISGWSRSLLFGLEALGVDGRAIMENAGLDPDEQGKPLVRNSVAKMQIVWRDAEKSVLDPNELALEIVKYLNASSFHTLSLGFYSSTTLSDLFRRLVHFREILSSSVDFKINRDAQYFTFTIIDQRQVRSHLTTVVFILFLFKVCRELKGPSFAPLRIETSWANTAFASLFSSDNSQMTILYVKDKTSLVFPVSYVDEILSNGSGAVSMVQDQLCRDYVNSLDLTQHLSKRVRRQIQMSIAGKCIDLGGVAKALNMSTRSLQRKLKLQGLSFADILNSVRKELAFEYARNLYLPTTEIAYLLGYSSISQFSMAFRGWHGCTFRQYRKQI